MRRTPYIVNVALCGLVLLGSFGTNDLAAQTAVRFELKDGTRITGELLAPEQPDVYRVRVGDEVVEIEHASVFTTKELTSGDARETQPITTTGRSVVNLEETLRVLADRSMSGASLDDQKLFSNAVAAVARNEWDFALRALDRTIEHDPSWSSPRILACLLRLERGEIESALVLAVALQESAADDIVAQRVVAETYRRAAFPRLHAELMESVLEREFGGSRAIYESVRIWWPVDHKRATALWADYVAADPLLSRPWCEEGRAIRSANLSLGVGEWAAAQAALDDARYRFPWLASRLDSLRVDVLEKRFAASKSHGSPEEALAVLAALSRVVPDRAEEWQTRRLGLVERLAKSGLESDTIDEFVTWSSRFGHLVKTSPEQTIRVSQKLQVLGLRALSTGEIENAKRAFGFAMNWDAEARPENLDTLWNDLRDRFAEDLRLRRRLRLLSGIEVAAKAFPERSENLETELAARFRESFATNASAMERSLYLDELHDIFRRDSRSPQPGSGLANLEPKEGTDSPMDEQRRNVDARPQLTRYFPIEEGTRWIYELTDGRLEEREIVAVIPLQNGRTRVQMKITGPDPELVYTRNYFFANGQLRVGTADVPPGQIELQHPLTEGQSWSWKSGELLFERELSRNEGDILLPSGTFSDVIVVEGRNSISSEVAGREYSTWLRFKYAAGVGLISVEAEDASLTRTLVDFQRPQRSARAPR